MTRTGINLIKVSLLILTAILFRNVILNSITLYQSVSQGENSASILFGFILGTVLGLIIRSGLTFVFWYSYNIKYPNENYNERISKKILASFLFLSIISAFSWGAGMPLVFTICTLAMIIRKHKRCETVL